MLSDDVVFDQAQATCIELAKKLKYISLGDLKDFTGIKPGQLTAIKEGRVPKGLTYLEFEKLRVIIKNPGMFNFRQSRKSAGTHGFSRKTKPMKSE